MNRLLPPTVAVAALICAAVLMWVSRLPAASPRVQPHATTSGQSAPTAGNDLDDTARVLAGLPPSSTGRLAHVATTPEWQTWRQEFDRQWTIATQDRFRHVIDWRDRELKRVTAGCSTLLYPFSGPDILNAVLLFPDCERYILFGLEQPGSLPALERLPGSELSRLFEQTGRALNTLLARNYFITKSMLVETAATELHGTLPLMAVFLARMDARVVSVRDVEVAEDGRLRDRGAASTDREAAPAVEVVFARPGRAPQTLVYFRAQAEDRAIDGRPGVRPFLERQGQVVTFLKSASYLLHTAEFTRVRDLLLRRSRVVLEDDSGIPLRFFKASDWILTFYGRYSRPVKDFNYGYQPDMEKVYSTDPRVKALPFGFGYHWADGEASVVLAVRALPVD